MKRLILTIIMYFLIVTQAVQAGGLNRINGMGQKAGGMAGAATAVADDPASLFYYNPAGMSQFDITIFDTSVDLVMPRYSYTDLQGNQSNSTPGKTYLLPAMGLIKPLSDRLTIGLGVTNPYAQASAFGSGRGIPNSEVLISLTNVTPAVSFILKDNLFVGVGLNIGWAQFQYQAPFDINGHFLPIDTKNKATGFGLGYTIGLMYRPNCKWTLGLTYMSELKTTLQGESDIAMGLLKIHDQFDSAITFPQRVGVGMAYQASNTLLLAFDANWYGYSHAMKSISLDFDQLPLVKTSNLNWQDNYSLHFGARYNLNSDFTVSAGVAYQTAAIPNKTISTLGPDVSGWGASLGLEYQRKNFSAGLTAIYGWGSREVEPDRGVLYPGKYEAEVVSINASLGWKF